MPISPGLNRNLEFLWNYRDTYPGEENVIEEYRWVRLVTDDWEYTERVQ